MEIGGAATINCTVTARGTLEACSVSGEDPPDQNFGDAALKLSRIFKMKPLTKDGVPVEGGHFSIRIRFQVPKG
jgi:protein TonB